MAEFLESPTDLLQATLTALGPASGYTLWWFNIAMENGPFIVFTYIYIYVYNIYL